MRNKIIYFWGVILALGLVLIGIYEYDKLSKPSAPSSKLQPTDVGMSDKITYTNASRDLIYVETPLPEEVAGKEFSVIGEAVGSWFFEASFPIQILDKDGKVLATAIAQAQKDWMTSNFVPFKADVQIPENYIGAATVVLQKDNPSDLSEHDASISFPINIEY